MEHAHVYIYISYIYIYSGYGRYSCILGFGSFCGLCELLVKSEVPLKTQTCCKKHGVNKDPRASRIAY